MRPIFKHALVRDAAYENLLKTRRHTITTPNWLTRWRRSRPRLSFSLITPPQPGCRTGRTILAQGWRAGGFAFGQEGSGRSPQDGIGLLADAPDLIEKPRLDLELHSALASVLMVTQGYGSDEVGRISTRTVELCRQVGDEGTLAVVLWQAWLFNDTRANH